MIPQLFNVSAVDARGRQWEMSAEELRQLEALFGRLQRLVAQAVKKVGRRQGNRAALGLVELGWVLDASAGRAAQPRGYARCARTSALSAEGSQTFGRRAEDARCGAVTHQNQPKPKRQYRVLLHKQGVKLMIDAEQSHLRPAIDHIGRELMREHNKPVSAGGEGAVIFMSYQSYLRDVELRLQRDLERAERQGYVLGAKLVRDEARDVGGSAGGRDMCACARGDDRRCLCPAAFTLRDPPLTIRALIINATPPRHHALHPLLAPTPCAHSLHPLLAPIRPCAHSSLRPAASRLRCGAPTCTWSAAAQPRPAPPRLCGTT